MTDSSPLERGYRRLLACYPKAFRRENEDEILAVLLATAGERQRRVGLAESVDLIKGAIKMHLGMSRSPRPVLNAVRLMCLGAVLELVFMVTVLVTLGNVRSAIVQDFTAAQWHTAVLTQIVPVLASAPIVAGVWLWLAWANGRGYDGARFASVALVGLLTARLLIGLGEGAALYAPADLIATTVLWLAGLAATVLIFSRRPARTTSRNLPSSSLRERGSQARAGQSRGQARGNSDEETKYCPVARRRSSRHSTYLVLRTSGTQRREKQPDGAVHGKPDGSERRIWSHRWRRRGDRPLHAHRGAA